MSARPTPDYGSEGFADEDTIEMVFTPDQMRMLSAAQSTASDATDGGASVTEVNVAAAAPSRRWLLGQSAAILGVAVALMGLGSVAHRAAVRQPMAPVAQTAQTSQTALVPQASPTVSGIVVQTALSVTPVAAEAAATAASAAESTSPSATDLPVRIRNPFDRTEVFEFPPGTSQDEARQAVADRLLDRARERRTSLPRPTHHVDSRTADSRMR
jgi:hypothetical protein